MSFSTFLTRSLITLGILFIIVKCWIIIFVIGYSLYVLGQLLFWSLIPTIIWVVFISNNSNGWGWVWFYFFILFSGIIVVFAMIAMDIFEIAVDWIGDLIKKIR